MKATELMIGDWVAIQDSPKYYKVESIDILTRGDACRLVYDHYIVDTWCDRVYPIPLTAEILEMNGFEGSPIKDMYLHMGLWERCQLKVELYPSEGSSVFVYADKVSVNMYVPHILLYINYVHELQHALRLCGLNELADNFKI